MKFAILQESANPSPSRLILFNFIVLGCTPGGILGLSRRFDDAAGLSGFHTTHCGTIVTGLLSLSGGSRSLASGQLWLVGIETEVIKGMSGDVSLDSSSFSP